MKLDGGAIFGSPGRPADHGADAGLILEEPDHEFAARPLPGTGLWAQVEAE